MEINNKDVFSLPFKVRDYECDIGDGVNNAVYLHYLEVGRYEFLRQVLKWDTAALTRQNIGFVVARIEVDFRRSLVSGEEFVVETTMERVSKHRFLFTQDIYRSTPRKVILNSKVYITPINLQTLRAEVSDTLEELLGDKYPVPTEQSSDLRFFRDSFTNRVSSSKVD